MEISAIMPHAEAIIFASEKPVTTLDMVELINNALAFMEERATLDQVEAALEAIREKYRSEFYPFEVRESGGGWQFLTKADYHKTVALLNGDKFLKRLSTAALETLAIVAYKQPITKGEIENIRGVNCDYAVQKLLEKELVVILGRKEDAPGHPLIYGTSKSFMDYFGINSTADLPRLNELIGHNIVAPTAVAYSQPVDEDIEVEVADDGLRQGQSFAINKHGEFELSADNDPTRIDQTLEENETTSSGTPDETDDSSETDVDTREK